MTHTKAGTIKKYRRQPSSAASYGIDGDEKLSRITRQGFDQLALKLFLGAFAAVFALALKDFAWRRQLLAHSRQPDGDFFRRRAQWIVLCS
jgi:hypothetical protein